MRKPLDLEDPGAPFVEQSKQRIRKRILMLGRDSRMIDLLRCQAKMMMAILVAVMLVMLKM